MHVGIAGTGRMGTAMARRLLSQGHQVSVWNRTAATAAACVAAGARQVATARELAGACDIVISVVLDAAALEAVYGGEHGLLAGAGPGKTFIEMSTVRPQVQQANAAKVVASGAGYVECPVGGSTGPALEGRLMGFAGGSEGDVAAARPVLNVLCRRLEHLGPVGAGSSMKLAINLPLMVYWQAFGEAMGLIAQLDVDPQRVVDIFSETSGGPNMLKVRGGMIAQALGKTPSGAVTVNVATIRKDLRTMIDETASLERVAPLTAQALACFDRAAAAGVDPLDCTELPAWWVREGGLKP